MATRFPNVPSAATGVLVPVVLACTLAAGAAPALGQANYPNKPMRLVVGVAPGGGADILGQIGRAHV